MHVNRLASFLLGLWLGGGLLMAWVAANSFRSVDEMLYSSSPEAQAGIKALGSSARPFLRQQVAEQNKQWFREWETAQLVIGLLFLFYLLFGTKVGSFPIVAAALMVGMVAVQRFLLAPALDAFSDKSFWVAHSAYTSIEALKYGLGLAVAVRFFVASRRKRSDDAWEDVDLVDKPNHGHVNR